MNPGQAEKQTTIEYVGQNGELVVANPSKPGKDGNRLFRFNKVYGPNSTQGIFFKLLVNIILRNENLLESVCVSNNCNIAISDVPIILNVVSGCIFGYTTVDSLCS